MVGNRHDNTKTESEEDLCSSDWDEFAVLDEEFEAMQRQLAIDGRRVIEPDEEMEYQGLTW